MLSVLIWAVSAFAFSIEDGVFVCVQSEDTVEKRKNVALEKTASESNFLIRSKVRDYLKGKPDMCRTYSVENHSKGFRITCDDKPTIDLRTDGTPTEYPSPKGKFSRTAKVTSGQVVQNFDFAKAGFRVTYIQTEKGFDVIKSISSSYLGAPLKVRASYIKK